MLKIQHDDSPNGLRDGVDTVCIVWVVVWVGWRGEDPTSSGEVTTTSTLINHVAPFGVGHICRFIFKLKSESTSKRVGNKSVN